jgi:hypothetical protein
MVPEQPLAHPCPGSAPSSSPKYILHRGRPATSAPAPRSSSSRRPCRRTPNSPSSSVEISDFSCCSGSHQQAGSLERASRLALSRAPIENPCSLAGEGAIAAIVVMKLSSSCSSGPGLSPSPAPPGCSCSADDTESGVSARIKPGQLSREQQVGGSGGSPEPPEHLS